MITKAVKNIINNLINKVNFKRVNFNNSNELFIDIGSSSIKASINNEYITFRSSVREVINQNELTVQNNALCVNNKWFVIGESSQPVQNVNYKYQKDNLNILILYSIKLLSEKVNINLDNIKVNSMLPFNQLQTKGKLANKINGKYIVKDLKGKELKINLLLNKVYCEGETSLIYFNDKYKNKCDNTIIINIGNSTIDCINQNNIENSRQEILTINQGTNLLLSSYLKHLPQVPNSSLLNSFLKSGKYKFTKEQEKAIHEENKQYINSILFDIESLIKKVNPFSCNVVICGGGSMLLYKALKELLQDRYNLILPSTQEALYSELLGLKLICNDNIDNSFINPEPEDKEPKLEPEEEAEEEDQPQEERKVIDINQPKTKTTFEMFIELRKQGYTLKQIHEGKLLNLKYSSLKNYNSRLNKMIENNKLNLAI